MHHDYYNAPDTHQIEGGGNYPEKLSFFINSVQNIKKVKKNKQLTILDVGCHSGNMSVLFKKFGDVYGLDINKKAVGEANSRGIRAKTGDIFQIESIFKTIKFDIVIAADIIEHVFDTDLFLQKIKHILRTDGILLLSTPNLVSLGRRLLALSGRNPYCEYSAKANGLNVGHIRYYTFDDLVTQLQENGFRDVKVETDITNIPVKIIDRIMVKINPRLGRELYATAYK